MFESFKQTLIFSLQPDDVEISNLFIVKILNVIIYKRKFFSAHSRQNELQIKKY